MEKALPYKRLEGSRRALKSLFGGASDALLSVFFPAGCRICSKLLTRASRIPICQDCLDSFESPLQKHCEICGVPVSWAHADGEPILCRACEQHTYAFERARSFGIYEGPLAEAILLLKWERMEPLGAWFAARLKEIVVRERDFLQADLVVPVPLHRDRERHRGYNQAALLSNPLAKQLRLPHRALLLMRTRPRPNKQVLSLAERWKSVRGAFATRPGSQVDNQRVLLVDDVMTTGATLDACARTLLESGAKSVVGLTVARAARNPLLALGNGNL